MHVDGILGSPAVEEFCLWERPREATRLPTTFRDLKLTQQSIFYKSQVHEAYPFQELLLQSLSFFLVCAPLWQQRQQRGSTHGRGSTHESQGTQ